MSSEYFIKSVLKDISIVHHTLAQAGERIEADHPLKQGAKGMKASHTLIQSIGKCGGRGDLIQGIFTQTKSITDHGHDHDHV